MNSLSNPMMNRNYAMDTLRALMMIIGIVFHASIIFCHKQYVGQWTLLDKHSSYFFDVLIGIIHSFRMPLFFFASGFCTSILYQKKGTKDFLKNRFKRIALPFLAAYIIICPLMELVTFYGNYKLNAMPFSMSNFLNINAYLFHPLYHLWFLYYLIFYVLLVATFEQIFKNEPVIITQFKHFIKRINQNFWFKFLGISTVFFIYFFFLKKTYLFIQLNWSIELLTFIIYFILFGYGWLVYKTKSLSSFSSGHPALLLMIGFIAYVLAHAFFIYDLKKYWYFTMIFSAFSHVLFFLGFLSLVLRKFDYHSKIAHFILNASYWTYLIHVIFIVLTYMLINNWIENIYMKFILLLIGTTILCFLSYILLVKNTFIGYFLNGKKIK